MSFLEISQTLENIRKLIHIKFKTNKEKCFYNFIEIDVNDSAFKLPKDKGFMQFKKL